MKTIIFYNKKKINKYNTKFLQPSYYSVKETKLLFWFLKIKYEVLFFNNQDIIKLLQEKTTDLLLNEFNLFIKSQKIIINSLQNIVCELNTNNNKLLTGKFGQNQVAISRYLTLIVSNFFKTKINVKVKFVF